MKKLNLPLLLGIILILMLLIVAVFPNLFTDRNPYSMSLLRIWTDETNTVKMETPPFSPDDNYFLGSDKVGRDIWSLVIFGTRLTLSLALMITFLRFLISVPLGMAGAMGSVTAKGIIDQFNIVLTTIPPLLIGILILKMDFFASLFKFQSAIVFILTLTIIGWARMGNLIYESSSKIMEETFILSEKAIGKTKFQIAVKNVFPHLLPEIVVLFFMEIARVLTLMMQLGIFGVFVGNVRIIEDSGGYGYKYVNLPYEPEWSGLLGAAKEYVRAAPWIVFTTAAFFVASVLAFNLFGEGLRIELQKRNSNFLNSFKNPFKNRKSIFNEQFLTLALVSVIAIVMVITVACNRLSNDQDFDVQNIIGYNFEEVIIGSDQSLVVGERIAVALEDMGVTPLKDDYYQTFSSIDNLYFDKSEIVISDNQFIQLMRMGEDIQVVSGEVGNHSFDVLNITENFYDIEEIDIDGKLLYVDSNVISLEAMRNSIEYFVKNGAAGIITTDQEIIDKESVRKPYYFLIASESFKSQLEAEDAKIEMKMVSDSYNKEASNILAVIEGKDPILKDKAIFIGMDYSFINEENSFEIINAYLSLVKNIKNNEDKMKKTIIFGFFPDNFEGVAYYSEHQWFPTKNILVYLDITGMNSNEFSRIKFSDELSPVSRYYGFTFSNQFEKKFDAILSENPVSLNETNRLLFDSKGYTTLLIETEGENGLTLNQFFEGFVDLIISNSY